MDPTRYRMKYEQLTLPGVFEEIEQQPREKEIINYAFPCGGCLCDKCANNVECLKVEMGEQIEPCFNCDYCAYYDGKGSYNKKYKCEKFIITEHEARKARGKLKVISKNRSMQG